jgi:hypothetical protein
MSKRKSPVPRITLPSTTPTPPNQGAAFDLLPKVEAEFENKQKLTILAKVYGLNDPLVDHDAAIDLLLRVCDDYNVAGMHIVSAHGRPKGTTKKWDAVGCLRLVAKVETIKRERACTLNSALHHLMKDDRTFAPKGARLSNEATSGPAIKRLGARYSDAKKIARKAFPRFDDPAWRLVAFNFLARMK